jgi:hypothetical protein
LLSRLPSLHREAHDSAVEALKVTIHSVQPTLHAGFAVAAPKCAIYSVQPTSHFTICDDHFLECFGLLIVLTHVPFPALVIHPTKRYQMARAPDRLE